jgi:hypothetical protein
MKFTRKEDNILLIITATVALYDFFTIPFNSFLITLAFAGILFYLTHSYYILAVIFIVPQFIALLNSVMGKKKENFNNITDISKRIQQMRKEEHFTNLSEISSRVESLKKEYSQPKVDTVSGIVNNDVESIAGNTSLPHFMREFEDLGTNVQVNSRIHTPSEFSIPASGTRNNFPRSNIHVSVIDDVSIDTALSNTTANGSTESSNLKSVEIDGKST